MKRDHNAGFIYRDTGLRTWSPIEISKSGFHWDSLDDSSVYQIFILVHRNHLILLGFLIVILEHIKGTARRHP